MNQSAFADSIGVKAQTVTDYKNGKAFPSADALVRIAERFNVSLDWLLLGKEVRATEMVAEDSPEYSADSLARKIRLLPEDQQRLLQAQVDTWLAMAREDSRKTSG